MPPPIPGPPSRAKIALSLLGLASVIISLVIAFQQPYAIWHWLLLLFALGCLYVSRRV